MIIESISDHLDLIETIGRWHWNEWGHADPGGSVKSWINGLAQRTERDAIPTTYVALSSDRDLLGSVTLVDCDMDTHSELWPWLAGLYVRPDKRNQGVGSALVRHVITKVGKLGVQTLYLYTSTSETLYRSLGWRVIDRDRYECDNVAIMSINVA